MIALWLAGCVFVDADDRDLRTPHWADVSIGTDATCAVRGDGTVRCWNFLGNDFVPDTEDAVAVSVGWHHACTLDSVGAAHCFASDGSGDEGSGGELDLVWLQAGVNVTCGLDAAGALECWGNESPSWLDDAPVDPVDALAVWSDACAVVGGVVTCWGSSGRDPELDGDFAVDVALGEDHSVCITVDSGEIRCGDTITPSRALEAVGSDLDDVSVMWDLHVCGLTDDRKIRCQDLDAEALIAEPPGGQWSRLSVRAELGCGITADGFLGCWGDRDDPRFPH